MVGLFVKETEFFLSEVIGHHNGVLNFARGDFAILLRKEPLFCIGPTLRCGTDGARGSGKSREDSQTTRRAVKKAAPSVALLLLVELSRSAAMGSGR